MFSLCSYIDSSLSPPNFSTIQRLAAGKQQLRSRNQQSAQQNNNVPLPLAASAARFGRASYFSYSISRPRIIESSKYRTSLSPVGTPCRPIKRLAAGKQQLRLHKQQSAQQNNKRVSAQQLPSGKQQ